MFKESIKEFISVYKELDLYKPIFVHSCFQREKTEKKVKTRFSNSLNKVHAKTQKSYNRKQSQISVIFQFIQHNKGSINETVLLFQTLNGC